MVLNVLNDIPLHLAWHLAFVMATCGVWDILVMLDIIQGPTVSAAIRSSWLAWPIAVMTGLLVANHFIPR